MGRFITAVYVNKPNPTFAKFAATMQFVKHKLSDKTYAAQEKRFEKSFVYKMLLPFPGDL